MIDKLMSDTSMNVPMLDLDVLRTLVAIADTGSFSAAADRVLRTPSAVSMQVKKVEDVLGRSVFDRDSRNVTLTRDGAFLVEHARRMLALNREALARFVTPDVAGEVRIGAHDDVAERFLPDMLCRFRETHPAVRVLVAVEGTRRLMEMRHAGGLDLAIITCQGVQETEKAEVLYREQLVWAMRKGGVAPEQDPLPLSVWEDGCAWRNAGIEGLKRQGRDWLITFESAHISGQKAAILADLAIAPIPVSSLGGEIVEAASEHGLPRLPEYSIGLVKDDTASAPVEAAADHLRAAFARARPSAAA